MKFKEFLNENSYSDGNYKQLITIDEAKKLLNTHCKNMDFNEPYWRGMSNGASSYILEGSKGNRKSINTSNHYTIIIDDILQSKDKNYPLRSKSIICANNYNLNTAVQFGEKVYAIFPYDNTIIGATSKEDIWFTSIKLGKFNGKLDAINDLFKFAGIEATSIKDITHQIELLFDKKPRDLDYLQKKLIKHFDNKESIYDDLIKAYSPDSMNFTFGNSNIINKIKGPRELWFGGKCIAIEYNTFKELQSNGFKIGN